jgi:threonine synthase
MNRVTTLPLSRVQALHCAQCGTVYSAFELQGVSACCQQPLVADYDLRAPLSHTEGIDLADSSMWRYGALLPLLDEANKVTLGEGLTPLLALPQLAARYELQSLLLKDEGQNPPALLRRGA